MRTTAALFLIVQLALAQGAPAQLVDLFGREQWGLFPEDRQRDIVLAWERYRAAPEPKRKEIERSGLKEFLLRPGKPFELPAPLMEEINRLARPVRPVVARLAVMRLRTLQLDRNLGMVPFDERRPLFDRLFPPRFDKEQARHARMELGKQVSRAMARGLREKLKAKEAKLGRILTKEEKALLVREASEREEAKILGRIRREIRRFLGADADDIRKLLEREGYLLLERHRLMRSPRQRELIRYAFRPERCPLIDLSAVMGERPTDAAERRVWEGDFRVLARIELLSGDFPPEMVLHLAAASSPADFFRAVQAFDPPRSSPPRR